MRNGSKLDAFRTALKRRDALGSFRTAKLAAEFYRNVIGTVRWRSTQELLDRLRAIGRVLVATQPRELALGNITRRVLHIIRDEHMRFMNALLSGNGTTHSISRALPADVEASAPVVRTDSSMRSLPHDGVADFASMRSHSLQNLMGGALERAELALQRHGAGPKQKVKAHDRAGIDTVEVSVSAGNGVTVGATSTRQEASAYVGTESLYAAPIDAKELRQSVLEAIGELMTELENVLAPVAEQALEHIHANEVILTYGYSRIVEEFLKEANRKRRTFSVIVAESAPAFEGHRLARSLSAVGIDTTLIHDAAVFALMARVNKVVIPTHAVLANGGVMVRAGGHIIACAAAQHSVPVVCLAGIFKLAPLYAHDQDTFNELGTPTEVLAFNESSDARRQVVPCRGLAPHSNIISGIAHLRSTTSEGDKNIAACGGIGRDHSVSYSFSRHSHVDVVNARYDYVGPELVDLHITNIGGHQVMYSNVEASCTNSLCSHRKLYVSIFAFCPIFNGAFCIHF